MYFPATYTFFPVWNVPRLVVTMHDTLALAHPELVFPTRRGRLAWLLKEHVAARMADRIVTVSETSRRDLQAWFRLPADRLRVITEGPDPIFRPGPRTEESDRDPPRSTAFRPTVTVPALRRRPEPAQEPASAGRGVCSGLQAAPNVLLVIVGDFGDVFHTHVPGDQGGDRARRRRGSRAPSRLRPRRRAGSPLSPGLRAGPAFA